MGPPHDLELIPIPMASANVLALTKENFDAEVMKSTVPVLVDFWAEWCGPCKMIAPVLDEIAAEYLGKAKVGKINVDEQFELAQNFKVSSIPMLLIIKNGQVVDQFVGARPKSEFKAKLDKVV